MCRELNDKVELIVRFEGGDESVLEDHPDIEFEDKEGVESEINELRNKVDVRGDRLDELEALFKWNVDNICHVAKEKTFINKNETQDVNANIIPLGSDLTNDDEEDQDGDGEEEEEKSSDINQEDDGDGPLPTPPPSSSSNQQEEEEKEEDIKKSTTTKKKKKKKKKSDDENNNLTPSLMSYHDFVYKYEDLLESFSEMGFDLFLIDG